MSTFDYDGQQRFVAGRLRYPTPPAPGTILGPNDFREYLVVLGDDGEYSLVGYATTEDKAAALRRTILEGDARSAAEVQLARTW